MKTIDKDAILVIIGDIEDDIKCLALANRLCDPLAEPIAVKYDLHGTIEEATVKLNELKQTIIDNKYTKEMLIDIAKRHSAYITGMLSDSNPYREQIDEAWKSDDGRKLSTMQKREYLRRQKLHEKKECICFL